MARTLQDRQKEKWALISKAGAANDKLAIFVHGFRGTYLSTWGQLPDFLQNDADMEPVLSDWDYLFIGYDTDSIGTFLNIAKLISTQWDKAAAGNAPFESKYKKVALFGHSLGTLGIRQLLCAISEQPKGMLDALHCTGLLGTPLNGSGLARYGSWLKWADGFKKPSALLQGSYAIAEALVPGNPQLEMLHVWNESIRGLPDIAAKGATVLLGTDDQVVGTGGLVKWNGDNVQMTALDHIGICKIEYNGAKPQSVLLDLLRNGLKK